MTGYATIMLVEDDLSLAKWIQDYLQQQGYEVVHLARGDQVVAAVQSSPPSLVLLDLMLPGLDGISVCRQLRAFCHLPIIMLTAQGEEVDEVLGLEMGATDYLVKPVRPRVLLARIKSALRREPDPGMAPEVAPLSALRFGPLHLNLSSRRVTLHEQQIALSSSEFSLLAYLAERAGQIVSRDELFMALKRRPYDGRDRSLDIMISVVRKKLGDSGDDPKGIKTVWAKGYLFVADGWS